MTLKKYIPILLLLLCFGVAEAQTGPNQFWIELRDKANSPWSVSRPEEFLGPKALERRAKQGIAVIADDLPVNPSYVAAIRATGARVLFTSRWFNSVTIECDSATLEVVQDLSFVVGSERVLGAEFGPDTIGMTDPVFPSLPRGHYGAGYAQISLFRGDTLHQIGFQGEGMTIAVMDAGFLKVDTLEAFKALRDEGRLLGTKDFVDFNDTVTDVSSHGMVVLSSMAAWLPGTLVGTAPKASYYLLRTENNDSEYPVEGDAWVAAAEWADSAGVWIINTSLGYSNFDDPSLNYTYEDMDGSTTRISIGARYAAARGMLVVNSAGNSGRGPWKYITAPADAFDILAVGAVDSNRNIANFSSRGPTVDGRVKPDVSVMGVQVAVASLSEGELGRSNGTSLASPLIAGMVACLWQAFPDRTNFEIMDAVRGSASHFSNPNDSFGYGIPDFALAYQLLIDPEFGKEEGSFIRNVYPNPFRDELNITLRVGSNQEVEVRLTDVKGRTLERKKFSLNEGYTTITLDFPSKLVTGNYVVSVVTREGVLSRNLFKRFD